MTEPVAYLNGLFLPAHQAALPIDDAGFVLGATVTEQLRTFRGRLFAPPVTLNGSAIRSTSAASNRRSILLNSAVLQRNWPLETTRC